MDKDNTQINGSGSIDSDQSFEFESVEKILNYKFQNKSLLLQAFTDSTYDEKCPSYKRLEYLGDTVLNMVMTKEIFYLYPEELPGSLTKLRAANVDTEKLARVAVKHNLHHYLRHKKPFLGDQIMEFVKAIKDYPLHSCGLLQVPKSLANIVESTIGAVYVDCDSTEILWKVIKPLLEPIITLDKLKKHPVTELYEMCQKKNLKLTIEDNWVKTKDYFFLIEGRLAGHGHHLDKKETARNCAAKNAINNFSEIVQGLYMSPS